MAIYPLLRPIASQAALSLTQGTAISDLTDLQAMSNDLTGNYYLTGDIDASGSEFTPIGNGLTTWFTGTFDGNGYTIDGLNIDSTGQYKALFGAIKGTAIIYNVTLTNVDILGRNRTAGLVGDAKATSTDEPKIQNCHVSSGTIKVKPGGSAYDVGGLIGRAYGDTANSKQVYIYDSSAGCSVDENGALVTNSFGGFIGLADYAAIQNCYATGDVDGTDTTNAGGFIGEAAGAGGVTITRCYATGDVIAETGGGGFIGGMVTSTTISRSWAEGNVSNTESNSSGFGGFAGTNAGGTITDCYAWGNVTSDQANAEVGGFIGEDTSGNATFSQAYAIGIPTGQSTPGGFIGSGNTNTFNDVYWNSETSGTSVSDGGTAHVTNWFGTKDNYPSTWDFDTIWYLPGTASLGSPRIREVGYKPLQQDVSATASPTFKNLNLTGHLSYNGTVTGDPDTGGGYAEIPHLHVTGDGDVLGDLTVGGDASITEGLTISSLTASRLLSTDAGSTLASTDLSTWIAATTDETTVADDGDGTITIGIADPLIVGKGGSGAATFTDHSILLGSGTDAFTALGAATNGQLPIGSTGADPVLASLTGTANQITVTDGAGAITLSTPQDIHSGASPTFAALALSNKFVGTPDEITATSDGVAASVNTLNTEVTTNGDEDLDNVTLANGTSGQIKHIFCVVAGHANDTWKITPATMIGGTQITFTGVGEGCTLAYADSEGWCVVANNGGTIS